MESIIMRMIEYKQDDNIINNRLIASFFIPFIIVIKGQKPESKFQLPIHL